MDNLINKIKKYFTIVELHEKDFQEYLKEAKKPLNSIINQSTLFRAVAPEDSISSSPFKSFEGFRESLYDIIQTSLEEEIVLLEAVRNKIRISNEGLLKEQKIVQKLYNDVTEKKQLDVSKINPCCPRLEHIIEWCCDVWIYYHSFYLQISQALVKLDLESEESVKLLSNSFEENLDFKKDLNRIRSFNFSNFEFFVK